MFLYKCEGLLKHNNDQLSWNPLHILCGFPPSLGTERRRQNEAETFHHCFFFWFSIAFTKAQVPIKIPTPVYSSRKMNVLLCLHDHTCMWGKSSRTHRCQNISRKKLPFPSFPTSCFSEIFFIHWKGQIWNRAMNICLWPQIFCIFGFKQNLNIQVCVNIIDFLVGWKWGGVGVLGG